VGRGLPSEKTPKPAVYRMKIFAKNHVIAKSRFWYFISRLKKVKKANGEILAVERIRESGVAAHTYGIFLRYNSRTGTHNMYKEYRAINRVSAVVQMYNEMAGRHRAGERAIQIIQIAKLSPDQVKRAHIKQYLDPNLKFPLPHHIVRPSRKEFRKVFAYKKPKAVMA